MKNKGIICFRLRAKRDKDLITALSRVEEGEISNLIRRGLRAVLDDVLQKEKNVIHLADIKEEPPKRLEWNFPK